MAQVLDSHSLVRWKVKNKIWFAVVLILGLGPVGCSDVAFKSRPNKLCTQFQQDFGSSGCVMDPKGFNVFNYSVNVGEVDILFVDDNSTSMYKEQTEMALRFPGFLDSIYRLDYRIGVITTDWRPDFNGGSLLPFANGNRWIGNSSRQLDSQHTNNIDLFQKIIKRQETLDCQASGFSSSACPTGDERGIYSLNLALDRAEQRSFFRTGGHLAVVILSDENERSNGGQISGYGLEPYDQPAVFVEKAKNTLGATKSLSVHSIVIRPGDQGCLDTQNAQGGGVKGFFGTLYAALSQPDNELKSKGPIIAGTLGNICSSNYTTELGDIASKINQTLSQIQLPCSPIDMAVDVGFDPAPLQQIFYSVDAQNRLNFTPAAPAGTKVTLKYKCAI